MRREYIVTHMGVSIRLGRCQYLRYLRHVAGGGDNDPAPFGRVMPQGVVNVTDMSPGWAAFLVEKLEQDGGA